MIPLLRLYTFALSCFVAILAAIVWVYTPDVALRATIRTTGRALITCGYFLIGVAGNG